MKGRLPNLLVIGAMKSGTTSLHDYLDLHPDIYMFKPKEVHFYADSNFSEERREAYMNLFKTSHKIVGTSPQSYTKCHNKYYKNIPERIFNDTPNVKMIYLVRDPIERYKSHILESYHCDPKEDIRYSKESGNYWKTSMYGMQLEAYLKFFPIHQIHIMCLEDLKENPLRTMNKAFSFLGLEEMKEDKGFSDVKNAASTKAIPRVIKENILHRIGMKINSTITTKISEVLAQKFYANQLKKPQLSDLQIAELTEKLKDDMTLFRALTKKEFPKWSI